MKWGLEPQTPTQSPSFSFFWELLPQTVQCDEQACTESHAYGPRCCYSLPERVLCALDAGCRRPRLAVRLVADLGAGYVFLHAGQAAQPMCA